MDNHHIDGVGRFSMLAQGALDEVPSDINIGVRKSENDDSPVTLEEAQNESGLAMVKIPSNFVLISSEYFKFNAWRIFILLTSIPSLISFILIYQYPETPRYLMFRADPTQYDGDDSVSGTEGNNQVALDSDGSGDLFITRHVQAVISNSPAQANYKTFSYD